MLLNEAKWIGNVLNSYSVEQLTPLVNLGSSTKNFREKGQSFIYEFIIHPLEKRGVTIVHVDIEPGQGVDIVGDIFDEDIYSQILSHNPKSVICANILEHVIAPHKMANLCVDMIQRNGFIVATVPYSFPFHLAPIDTMFRPTVEELADMFPGGEIQASEIVNCGTFGQQIVISPKVFFKHIVKMLIPWPTAQHWKAAMHRNLWLFKEYQTTCVVLKK